MTKLADVDNEEWNTFQTLWAQLFHHKQAEGIKETLSGVGGSHTPFTKEKDNLITVTAIV